jgi:molybdopterin/thiamine biosynthesis adenylyltransferase
VAAGVICIEIVKFLTRVFHPFRQLFVFTVADILAPSIQETIPPNSSYPHQRVLIGSKLQEKLQSEQVFVAGAGATGCELLKLFTMMGAGTERPIFVADPDIVSESNRSRQYMYRTEDVANQSPKVHAAAKFMKQLRPNILVEPISKKLSSDTWFDPFLFTTLSQSHTLFAMLDSVDGRVFTNKLAKFFGVRMIECGTDGFKGNVQSVVPFVTKDYIKAQNNPLIEVANCLPKGIPEIAEQVIPIISSFYSTWFFKIPELMRTAGREYWTEQMKEIEGAGQNGDYSDLIITHFNTLFQNPKIPNPQKFDLTNPQHVKFSKISTTLFQRMLQIEGNQIKITPLPFEKDDSLCIEWVTTVSQLAAIQWNLPTNRIDPNQVRFIAGDMGLASVSTTAVVSGVVFINWLCVCCIP